MHQKPFAESSEQNKLPILEILKIEFADKTRVLEIGSGTGQHAVFFAKRLNHLTWQPSELEENIPGINAWIADSPSENLLTPIELNVSLDCWPKETFDAVFSANTVHIMGLPEVELMFEGISLILHKHGCFCLYGPFNYNNQFTSESNARFDMWLKNQDLKRGIRNFEDLNKLAARFGLKFKADYEMPVNNRILVWRKN